MYSKSYEQARQIAQTIADFFFGAEFNWSRGRVLDGRPGERIETEDLENGVWQIAQDIQFLFTDIAGGALT